MIPTIVTLAASVAAADHAGIVEYRIRQTSAIDGGPIHEHDDITIAVVTDANAVIKVRVLSFLMDGKEQPAAAKQKIEGQIEAEKDRFVNPFDARAFADYSFTVDGSTVHFVALKRDGDHGDGSFQVDPAGHVLSMTYSPDAMPKYADSGTTTLQRGQVLPGLWATTVSTSQFKGHYLFFHGTGTFSSQQSGFRRFATRAAALADLQALQE